MNGDSGGPAGLEARSGERGNLVARVVERLRERIFENEPEARLGSLSELAAEFGVGIVTIQQSARVLEHEGLLEVRRGPGGGYYGRRPDDATLERALSAYMRMHPDSFHEALDITSLLFIELCGAAARCGDEDRRRDLAAFAAELARGEVAGRVGTLETRLQDLLFRMVQRPIFELLTRVTLSFARNAEHQPHTGVDGPAQWLSGRERIVAAIVSGDESLARFEADRSNRQPILAALGALSGGPGRRPQTGASSGLPSPHQALSSLTRDPPEGAAGALAPRVGPRIGPKT